jgi:hypothetical protein
MRGRCPFCWSRSAVRAVMSAVGRPVGGSRRLMECRECERWFWADSGEEVARLFELCVTPVIHPGRCETDIRKILNSGGNGFQRRRSAEFNTICSGCPGARFAAGRIAARA